MTKLLNIAPDLMARVQGSMLNDCEPLKNFHLDWDLTAGGKAKIELEYLAKAAKGAKKPNLYVAFFRLAA